MSGWRMDDERAWSVSKPEKVHMRRWPENEICALAFDFLHQKLSAYLHIGSKENISDSLNNAVMNWNFLSQNCTHAIDKSEIDGKKGAFYVAVTGTLMSKGFVFTVKLFIIERDYTCTNITKEKDRTYWRSSSRKPMGGGEEGGSIAAVFFSVNFVSKSLIRSSSALTSVDDFTACSRGSLVCAGALTAACGDGRSDPIMNGRCTS